MDLVSLVAKMSGVLLELGLEPLWFIPKSPQNTWGVL
jgi:hypothetical protein